MSASPALSAVTASWSAVLPLAQAFSTFTTGISPMPMLRSAISPRIMCCPSIWPCVAFAKNAASMAEGATPASSSAAVTACRASCFTSKPGWRPNGVMPTPRM